MNWIIRAGVGLLLFAAVVVGATSARGDDLSQFQGRTALEGHARDLDHRLIELQHDLIAARHTGDPNALARAETELKKVQVDRIETLRALGEIR